VPVDKARRPAAVFVPTHSGGSAMDFHHLPLRSWDLSRPTVRLADSRKELRDTNEARPSYRAEIGPATGIVLSQTVGSRENLCTWKRLAVENNQCAGFGLALEGLESDGQERLFVCSPNGRNAKDDRACGTME
jgi:hypothetical protein